MLKLFAHYISKGYGPRIAFKLARNRVGESKRIATKMIEQNVFNGGAK